MDGLGLQQGLAEAAAGVAVADCGPSRPGGTSSSLSPPASSYVGIFSRRRKRSAAGQIMVTTAMATTWVARLA